MKKSTLTFASAILTLLAMTAGCSLPNMQQEKAGKDMEEALRLAQNGDIPGARIWCDRAIAIDPQNVKVYVGVDSHKDDSEPMPKNIADLFQYISDDPSIVTYMQQATQKFPTQAIPWLRLAEAYHRMGKPADQMAAGKKAAAAIEPDIIKPGGGGSAERMNTLAEAYLMAGNAAQATQTLQRVIATYPANAEAYNILAMYYADSNDIANLPQALTLVNKAISKTEAAANIEPEAREQTLAAYTDTLGWVQYRMHQYPAAIINLQKAIAVDPRQAEERYHLGLAYLALDAPTATGLGIDSKAAARSEFQIAVATNPTYADPANELKKLGPATTTADQDDSTGLL